MLTKYPLLRIQPYNHKMWNATYLYRSYLENTGRKYYCSWWRNTSGNLRVFFPLVMAAHSNNFIRVRLHFDYPPPALVDCRMCWLLVDLNTCRVVADLESIIREKFDFSRRSILNLFIEDCYLPHTESIYVVRDNDSVRCASLCCWTCGLVIKTSPLPPYCLSHVYIIYD